MALMDYPFLRSWKSTWMSALAPASNLSTFADKFAEKRQKPVRSPSEAQLKPACIIRPALASSEARLVPALPPSPNDLLATRT
jgi:hypothetical protein